VELLWGELLIKISNFLNLVGKSLARRAYKIGPKANGDGKE
jgi:hypothetical protein